MWIDSLSFERPREPSPEEQREAKEKKERLIEQRLPFIEESYKKADKIERWNSEKTEKDRKTADDLYTAKIDDWGYLEVGDIFPPEEKIVLAKAEQIKVIPENKENTHEILESGPEKEKPKENIRSIFSESLDFQDEIDDLQDDIWILTQDEVKALLWELKEKNKLLALNLDKNIWNESELSEEELEQVRLLKELLKEAWEILKPEPWEILLMALPVSQEVIASEKLVKIALTLEKSIARFEKIPKYHLFWTKGIRVINSAFELAKKWDLGKLKSIIRVLRNSKNAERIEIAEKLTDIKKEVQLIKIEWRWLKKLEKWAKISEWATESIEIEKNIESFWKLKVNAYDLFSEWVPNFSGIRLRALREIEKFESKLTDVTKVDKERYINIFKEMLWSHGVNTKELNTVEKIKDFLIHNK